MHARTHARTHFAKLMQIVSAPRNVDAFYLRHLWPRLAVYICTQTVRIFHLRHFRWLLVIYFCTCVCVYSICGAFGRTSLSVRVAETNSICAHINTHTHTHTHTLRHTHTHTHTSDGRVKDILSMRVCLCSTDGFYLRTRKSTREHIHTHIHTHTHPNAPWSCQGYTDEFCVRTRAHTHTPQLGVSKVYRSW